MNSPPRRLYCDDPDYRIYVGRLQVHFDGEPQKYCDGYDMDAGTVRRAKVDDAGQLETAGDEILYEIVTGKVEVSWIIPAGSLGKCARQISDAQVRQQALFRAAERALLGARWSHYEADELIKLIRQGAA